MVAAQSMTIVFGEMTYPVMGMIKWNKTYFSMIATPLSVRDVVVAQLGFVTFRVGLVSAVFLLVMAPFGVFTSVGGVLLAFLTQLLIGLAFATPLFALTAFFQSESGFSLVFRLGMIPMFLFSGAFFPVSNLNPVLEAVAKVTPLWHGVDLTRMFTLGTVDGVMVLVHVLYLGTFAVVGFLLVVRLLARRLVS
jgi:lipooligosaccharide transport system permease protein